MCRCIVDGLGDGLGDQIGQDNGQNLHPGIDCVAPKPHSDTHAAIPHGQFTAAFITLVDDLANIWHMDWIIERVDSNEEAVYLKKPLFGIARKICVPGAFDAFIEEGRLVIRASTGFVWEVEPSSGRRRRRACATHNPNSIALEAAPV